MAVIQRMLDEGREKKAERAAASMLEKRSDEEIASDWLSGTLAATRLGSPGENGAGANGRN